MHGISKILATYVVIAKHAVVIAKHAEIIRLMAILFDV